jgi:hypothetical protein
MERVTHTCRHCHKQFIPEKEYNSKVYCADCFYVMLTCPVCGTEFPLKRSIYNSRIKSGVTHIAHDRSCRSKLHGMSPEEIKKPTKNPSKRKPRTIDSRSRGYASWANEVPWGIVLTRISEMAPPPSPLLPVSQETWEDLKKRVNDPNFRARLSMTCTSIWQKWDE